MNNKEREMWINNDELLYNWKKASHRSMSKFISENRNEIDRRIHKALGRD